MVGQKGKCLWTHQKKLMDKGACLKQLISHFVFYVSISPPPIDPLRLPADYNLLCLMESRRATCGPSIFPLPPPPILSTSAYEFILCVASLLLKPVKSFFSQASKAFGFNNGCPFSYSTLSFKYLSFLFHHVFVFSSSSFCYFHFSVQKSVLFT